MADDARQPRRRRGGDRRRLRSGAIPTSPGAGKVVEPVDFRGGDDAPLPERGRLPRDRPAPALAIAEANGIACVGVAPGCSFMPVRFSIERRTTTCVIELLQLRVSRGRTSRRASWSEVALLPCRCRRGGEPHAGRTRPQRGARTGGGLDDRVAAGNCGRAAERDVAISPCAGARVTPNGAGDRRRAAVGPHRLGSPRRDRRQRLHVAATARRCTPTGGREISVAAPSKQQAIRSPASRWQAVDHDHVNEYRAARRSRPGRRYTNSFAERAPRARSWPASAALVKSAESGADARSRSATCCGRPPTRSSTASADPLYGTRGGTYDAQGHSPLVRIRQGQRRSRRRRGAGRPRPRAGRRPHGRRDRARLHAPRPADPRRSTPPARPAP